MLIWLYFLLLFVRYFIFILLDSNISGALANSWLWLSKMLLKNERWILTFWDPFSNLISITIHSLASFSCVLNYLVERLLLLSCNVSSSNYLATKLTTQIRSIIDELPITTHTEQPHTYFPRINLKLVRNLLSTTVNCYLSLLGSYSHWC